VDSDSIVYQLVELHGGTVSAESPVRGQGHSSAAAAASRDRGERTNFIRSPGHTPFRGAGNRGTRGSSPHHP